MPVTGISPGSVWNDRLDSDVKGIGKQDGLAMVLLKKKYNRLFEIHIVALHHGGFHGLWATR